MSDDDLIRRGDALATVQLGDTVTKIQARIAALPARGVGADAVLDAAHAYLVQQYGHSALAHPIDRARILAALEPAPTDAAQEPFRIEDMTLADLMRDPLYEAATTPTTAQTRSELAAKAPERIAIRYDGYEQSIQWDAGWHLPEGRENEVTYRREAPAAQVREAALREAVNVCKVFQANARTNDAWLPACEIEEAILALIDDEQRE